MCGRFILNQPAVNQNNNSMEFSVNNCDFVMFLIGQWLLLFATKKYSTNMNQSINEEINK